MVGPAGPVVLLPDVPLVVVVLTNGGVAMRPIVFHAGCGGEVTVERVESSSHPMMTCQRCERMIADPLELTPRGTGFVRDQESKRFERYRLDAA